METGSGTGDQKESGRKTVGVRDWEKERRRVREGEWG